MRTSLSTRPSMASATDTRTRTPRVDIWESDEAFLISAELPGVSADGVSLTFEEGRLSIEGTPAEAPEGTALLREVSTLPYARTFRVNTPVDADGITAKHMDGVLHVTLPKAEEARPKRIAVAGR